MPVEDRDQLRVHIDADRTIQGTLVELTEDSVALVDRRDRLAAPLGDIKGVDVRRFDTLSTVLLTTLIVLPVAAYVAVGIAMSSYEGW
jgi:hypothetical protein